MRRIWKEEAAGAMVENVIVLPLVFVVIFFMILSAFMMHDRATVEAAAKRGAIYAANCVSNPNYASIAGKTGELEIDYELGNNNFSFSGVGKKVDAYRAFTGGADVTDLVEDKVEAIVATTRIQWLPQESIDVVCTQKNMFIYQDITVTVSATYSLPKFFALFGLETNFAYEATARTRTTDPDEFIRNADLIVDLIVELDQKLLGGKLGEVTGKIGELAEKIVDWLPKGNEKGSE